jgi:hypothetical protein
MTSKKRIDLVLFCGLEKAAGRKDCELPFEFEYNTVFCGFMQILCRIFH